jgi:MFS family permease
MADADKKPLTGQAGRSRLFLSLFFFLLGFSFSSWTSRIPTIKVSLGYNDAQLGSVLLTMPVSALAGLPFSGWLVSRFPTWIPLTLSCIVNAVALLFISLSDTTAELVASLFLFSFSMRVMNISANTQAINLQKLYDRRIIGSFHGLWSTGGISGIAFCTAMLALDVSIQWHFVIAAAVFVSGTICFSPYLLRDDRATSGNSIKFRKPDAFIFYLGLLMLLATICEGGMFDWSGIYFKEVLGEQIFTTGYLGFMCFMALSRFVSDKIVERIGQKTTGILSAALIMAGIALAIIWPTYPTALAGFIMVGCGTASVVPLIYSLAGTSKKYSPGIAIAILGTYGITGMLVGPALVGYFSHAVGLRTSFVAFITAGFLMIPVCMKIFSLRKPEA